MIAVNLVGTFNLATQAAARMAAAAALNEDGERGVVVTTASVAAFEGQIGQIAYAASKGAVAAMTLPMARDLAKAGVRVVSIAPGLFLTPMLEGLPQEAQASLGGQVPFPARLGSPDEYAALVVQIAENADAERHGDPARRRDPHGAALRPAGKLREAHAIRSTQATRRAGAAHSEPALEDGRETLLAARLGGAAGGGGELGVAEHLADRADELRAVGDGLRVAGGQRLGEQAPGAAQVLGQRGAHRGAAFERELARVRPRGGSRRRAGPTSTHSWKARRLAIGFSRQAAAPATIASACQAARSCPRERDDGGERGRGRGEVADQRHAVAVREAEVDHHHVRAIDREVPARGVQAVGAADAGAAFGGVEADGLRGAAAVLDEQDGDGEQALAAQASQRGEIEVSTT